LCLACPGLVFDALGELCAPTLAAGFLAVLLANPELTRVLLALAAVFFTAADGAFVCCLTLEVLGLAAGLAAGVVLGEAGRPTFLAGAGPGLAALFSSNGACTGFAGVLTFPAVLALGDFERPVLVPGCVFLEETALETSAVLATLVLRVLGWSDLTF
jgi:hypothetical protein